MVNHNQNQSILSFTDLVAWQEGHSLVLMIYRETSMLPKSEKYNLVDQLQRAVVSITSNIAEGFARNGVREKIQFYYISLGSTKEVQNQLIICRDLKYITKEQYDILSRQSSLVNKLTYGLIKSLANKKEAKPLTQPAG